MPSDNTIRLRKGPSFSVRVPASLVVSRWFSIVFADEVIFISILCPNFISFQSNSSQTSCNCLSRDKTSCFNRAKPLKWDIVGICISEDETYHSDHAHGTKLGVSL